ncbi:response regulator [Pseudomonas sp. PDNC002]|uniref:response regulator n=1 Tax=Pseudomonas sp. PDNC002 TaxID=2811422 RepID=UPI0019667200|nr:response regulator [Pseudomonas sp. PDNC002]QRY77388.1 response regulator [Pseudomonas sp. PDNC002]
MSRIVIADPHPFIREALRQRLVQAGHDVIGETDDGRDALSLVQRLHPDLLILDLDLPRLGGLELLRRLRSDKARQKSLVFTHLSGAQYQQLSQQAGAQGFVHKDDLPTELDEAVKLVLSGRTVFRTRRPDAWGDGTMPLEHITPRELTVLHYLAQGYRVKDIAEELAISDRTVSTYKTRLLEKTQSDSLVDLVSAAHARGLLSNQQLSHLAQEPSPAAGGADDLIQLMEILPNAVSLWSVEGELLACNQRFADVHHKNKTDLPGAQIFDLGMTEAGHIARARQEFLKGAASGMPFSLISAGNLDAERRTYRLIGVPIKDGDGAVLGVMCSYVDITEHERYIEHLQESKAYLESIFASRSQFLSSAGRDLLQELDALGTLLSAARTRHPQDPLLGEAPPYLERMRDKIEVLLELIDMERETVLTIPHSKELNRLTRKTLEATHPNQAFVPTSDDHWAWIDPNRYQHLLNVLVRTFEKAGLPALTLHAEVISQPFAEITWQLTFQTVDGAPAESLLEGIDKQASYHLARRLCRLLEGTVQIGSDSRQEVVALIQLKLPKGTPRI